MSRHRNIRNMNYDDERDDEDDEEFHRYSISADDDAISPDSEEYLYGQPQTCFANKRADIFISDFIPEESLSELINDVVRDTVDQPITETHVHGQRKRGGMPTKSCSRKGQVPASKNGKEVQTQGQLKEELNNSDTLLQNGSTQQPSTQISQMENLRISANTSLKVERKKSPTVANSKNLSALDAARSAVVQSRKIKHSAQDTKPCVNVVIAGHVDAGKSTLMGHLLYQLGKIDERTMHRYKQESAKTGKASFAYAWILDDTYEERERGVTMDIARMIFETEHRKILILDAPGHKDFIPNMITGAAEADAGILVINANHGEFETGFDQGGQTREHAMLLRSLGVGQLLVAINKMDTVEWSQQRYSELCVVLRTFLRKQASYSAVKFVPLSGLEGVNLASTPPDNHPLHEWYEGPTLLQMLDELDIPVRSHDRPFRAVISDIHKVTSSAILLSAKIEAGFVENGDKVYIMPNSNGVIIKGVTVEASSRNGICFAGDQATISLSTVSLVDPDTVCTGHVLCRGGQECLIPGKRYSVRIVIFNIVIPIIKGTKAELFAHSLCEPCTITKLKAELNKATGEVLRHKPRALAKGMSGLVEIQTERAVSLEPYSECKALGRVTLRSTGQTIAAGIIEQRLS